MQLKEFSLLSPTIESGTVLKALETAIPAEAIEQALAQTQSNEERRRALPSHLVVCLVIGMSLWSKASMRTVLKNLVDGLSEAWVRVGQYWQVPKNVKFSVEKVLEDGSYLSWIAPDGKSKKKGGTKIMVRVIEYTIDTDDTDDQPQVYRLITSLTDIVLFPALLLATEYHRRWQVENTIDELKVHLLGRKTLIRSLNPREVVQEIYGWLLGHWAVRG
jgi:hypothetical protein